MEVPPEKGYTNLTDLKNEMNRGKPIRALCKKDDWPRDGSIVMTNVRIRYQKYLPYIIKEVSLKIESGSSVALVGRTGSGKTTLLCSLYGTFADYEGSIIIDNRELRDVPLKLLRQSITVIPQDPYIFSGTLLENLDPLSIFDKRNIQELLDSVPSLNPQLRDLGFKLEGGGANISQGERQIICIFRALLSKKKLILMDEATSSLDQTTDSCISSIIHSKLKGSTILMITHRTQNLLRCDK